jgi:hypothetical protein
MILTKVTVQGRILYFLMTEGIQNLIHTSKYPHKYTHQILITNFIPNFNF